MVKEDSVPLWFAVQVDEPTDADTKATMLALVQCMFQEGVHEDTLCAFLLPTNITTAELPNLLMNL